MSDGAKPRVEITAGDYIRLRRRLCAEVYRGDPACRDNTSDLLKMVTNPAGQFARGAELFPVTVVAADHRPLASALLIRARRLPDTMQIGFFEAVPNQPEAVDLLIAEARRQANRTGCRNIIAGMNGHVNNGLGILAGPFGKRPSFGSAYNPPHYATELARHASRSETLDIYRHAVSDFPRHADPARCQRAARRFPVRCGDFRDLPREMAVYTELNNRSFANHPYYFERTAEEDLELFRAFGPLLREENFLVAEHNGRPVGFMLWYPDFNEWTAPGASVGLGAAFRYCVLRQRPACFKLAEVGVLPRYQGTGVILALLAHCYQIVNSRYTEVETGWIHEANALSQALSTRWAGRLDKTCQVFHIDPRSPGQ